MPFSTYTILPSATLLKVTIAVVYLQDLFDPAEWRLCYDRQLFEWAEFFRYAIQVC